ncbi:hypothetical protein E2C01_069639 [Portunus trituberculatus]|uniref:Uncharacterized protein n=1 Tax=Portunus trituberculatus TaxID=210409 RepID=A0A5B7HZF5_PORTR|nr:hypothetical protein [Portunus trituberculatus]
MISSGDQLRPALNPLTTAPALPSRCIQSPYSNQNEYEKNNDAYLPHINSHEVNNANKAIRNNKKQGP